MEPNCTNIHPLARNGTDQNSRSLQSLPPSYIQMDERQLADYLILLKNYAQYLTYTNLNNQEEGNWTSFFEKDVSFLLADITNWPVKTYIQWVELLLSQLRGSSPSQDQLKFLFDLILSLASRIDRTHTHLPTSTLYKSYLRNLIQSSLKQRLDRILSYYKAAIDENLINPTSKAHPAFTDVQWFWAQDSIAEGYSNLWTEDQDWNTYYQTIIQADSSVFGEGATEADQLRYAASYNLFTTAIEAFLEGVAQSVASAFPFFEETVKDWPHHAPNNALLIAFLKLFQEAQKELNKLTETHLNFYYKDVLGMKPKGAIPAQAHVLIGLAKSLDHFPLKKHTAFRAGKDAEGKPIRFKNEQEVLINKGAVVALKNIFLQPGVNGRIYAAPIANSFDGLGASFPEEVLGWDPFGNVQMPLAQIGFAIASPYLFLKEGTRTITIDLITTSPHQVTAALLNDAFLCELSSEEGWLSVEVQPNVPQAHHIQLVLSLSSDLPAIVPFSPALHEGNFSTTDPVLRVSLVNEKNKNFSLYSTIARLALSSVSITAVVNGIKSLYIQTDAGDQDPSKTFFPFGPLPKKGSKLIIGSNEIFIKELSALSLEVDWKNYPGNANAVSYPFTQQNNPSLSAEYLGNGNWQSTSLDESGQFFNLALGNEANFTTPANITTAEVRYEQNPIYTSAARNGFIRLTIDGDFGRESRNKNYIVNLINGAMGDGIAETDVLGEPYVPQTDSLTAHYTATIDQALNLTTNFDGRNIQFFHVTPFGTAERHPKLLSQDANVYLLPQFYAAAQNEGELYIGLAHIDPLQRISILFQVVEGSANPLKEKPEPHIQWSYLSNNEWLPMASQEVADNTDALINSGIITFTIPEKATKDNSLLDHGLIWLRGSVHGDADTVCRIVGIHAQAVLTEFVDQQNDLSFLDQAVAAGEISKLVNRVASIKKVEQPYPSFGGKGVEDSAQFYVRASERLRHKKRSSTIWDYERMVLEEFPEIYRVKCISHTQFEKEGNSSSLTYNELAPGHVLIIPIAHITSTDIADRLKPYTSLGLLRRIAQFLEKYISPFVKLHVRNPEFNEIKVSCKVQFKGNFDRTTNEQLLEEALIQYLSPWVVQGGQDILFGAEWYASDIINFIEEWEYVEFLTDFKLIQQFSNGTNQMVNTAKAENARTILVSSAQHQFLTPSGC